MKYEVFVMAGPLRSRAAKAIGFIDDMINYSTANAPLAKELDACERCLTRGSGNREPGVFWEAVLHVNFLPSPRVSFHFLLFFLLCR